LFRLKELKYRCMVWTIKRFVSQFDSFLILTS
jgi:hypothetical protein